MRRSTTCIAPRLRPHANRATSTQAQHVCTTCRRALASSTTNPRPAAPSTSPLQAAKYTSPLTQPRQQYRSISTSLRRPTPPPAAQEAADEPRIKTLYDYFPHSIPEGPPPSGPFTIDTRALHREFLQLQASAHPDRHAPEHKARAETLSSLINDAYNTLLDPLRRAQYVLSLHGVDVANDETGKVEDQGLLMEVMEAQEGIEDARAEADLTDIKEANDVRLGESVARIEGAFGEGDIDAAAREAVRLRYWYNIRDGLVNWEPGKPVTLIH